MFPDSMLCENGWCKGHKSLEYPYIPPLCAFYPFTTSRDPYRRIIFPIHGQRALIPYSLLRTLRLDLIFFLIFFILIFTIVRLTLTKNR